MTIQLNTVGGQTVLPVSMLASLTGAAYDQQIDVTMYGDNYRDDVWVGTWSPLVTVDNVVRVSRGEITATLTIAASGDPAHNITLFAYNQWRNSAGVPVSAAESPGLTFQIGAAGSATDATQVVRLTHGAHFAPTIGAVDSAADYALVIDTDDGGAVKRTLVSSIGGGASTPTEEYLSAPAMTVTAMVDTVLVSEPTTCTLTLPAITAALDGNISSIKMEISDVSGAASTNPITIQPNAGDTGTLINGAATVTIISNYGSVTLQAVNYDGITYGGGHSTSRTGKHWKLS